MCIAIYKAAGATITDKELSTSALNNKDGCGFAGITTEKGHRKLVVHKCLDFKDFLPVFRKFEKDNPDSPMLIHFRIMTHGLVNVENCHPFWIDSQHVFIHNGTITAAPKDKDRLKSDTRMFNETILTQLPAGWMENDGICDLIEEYIGFSKVVTMDINGQVRIYNEVKGHWDKDRDIWFSNETYKKKKTFYSGYQAGTSSQPWSKTCGAFPLIGIKDKGNAHYNSNLKQWLCFDDEYGIWRNCNHTGAPTHDPDFDEYVASVESLFDTFMYKPLDDDKVIELSDYDECEMCLTKHNLKNMTYVTTIADTVKDKKVFLFCKECLDSQTAKGVRYSDYADAIPHHA
jgi:glutamine amidotransferase